MCLNAGQMNNELYVELHVSFKMSGPSFTLQYLALFILDFIGIQWNYRKFWFISVHFIFLCQNLILLYPLNLHYFVVSVQFAKWDLLNHFQKKKKRSLVITNSFSFWFRTRVRLDDSTSSSVKLEHRLEISKFRATKFKFVGFVGWVSLKSFGVAIINLNKYVNIFTCIASLSLIHSTYHRHQRQRRHKSFSISFHWISLYYFRLIDIAMQRIK